MLLTPLLLARGWVTVARRPLHFRSRFALLGWRLLAFQLLGTVTRRQTLLLGFLNRQTLFRCQLLLDVEGDLLVGLV